MTLRLARVSDGRAIAEIYRPHVESSSTSFELVGPTAEEMSRRIAETMARFPWLVEEVEDRVVGYAYATSHRAREAYQWAAEVSVYVALDRHRGGVARGLYERLLDTLVRQGFHVALAGITLPNAASVGFHEAMGFRLVGVFHEIGFKMGALRDVGWWERILHPGPPAGAPIPFADWRAQ